MIVGNSISQEFKNMHRWSSYVYTESSRICIFNKIQKYCQEQHITEAAINDAKVLYNGISKKILSRGHPKLGIIAACVYYGCRKRGIHKREKEIADLFKIQVKYVAKGIEVLSKHIFNDNTYFEEILRPLGIKDNVKLIYNLIDISDDIKKKIEKIIEFIEKKEYDIKNVPNSLAAGCVYFAMVNFSEVNDASALKKKISSVCGVSDVTVIKAFNNISIYREELLKLNK
jgi:transcription initiation factor TFIIIB Brf1 subunit/transcription initiation factor TFIIB